MTTKTTKPEAKEDQIAALEKRVAKLEAEQKRQVNAGKMIRGE